MKKLHFGCGPYKIDGWENHDLDVDLRGRLPFEDSSIDFIFTEHVVEHLKPSEAWDFYTECFRVLKPGGVIRTNVPSIVKMSQCATPSYVKFVKDCGWGDGSFRSAIKHIVFLHGHQSLWVPELLIVILQTLGFRAYETELYRSRFPELCNLEQHWRSLGRENNEIESIAVEGVKF